MGDASTIDSFDGGSSGTVTDASGPFWARVTSMDAKIPIGVGTLPSTTPIPVLGTGGAEKVALVTDNLPDSLGSARAPLYDDILVRLDAGGSSGVGFDSAGPWKPATVSAGLKGGNATPHDNMPPYIGVFFIQRTARLFRT